ncbi:hypothetical protein YYG_04220 [Plasmodium vinckei petteri]|uniref:DnaJ protein, putative n=1 Tax=Plasmodium vinckei petteri TaxID=138298 RepID=W7ABR1_PLAVN|nr:hypothetical protein YYG_04220 [Plasmodium vinckei petteri]CAD2101303.1 DnaJ protein, putative [Plasmodium vinckei petteri]
MKRKSSNENAAPQGSSESTDNLGGKGNKGKGNNNVTDIYKNKLKFMRDNIILISIILSFFILISFKYLEEKYSIESYLEEGDSFDYYEILKCKKGDSIQKIKKSYRDLSKIYHPDSNKNCKDCDQKFRDITKAYKTLSDSRLKEAYDNSRGKVLKLIESNSVNLHWKNYTDLVENSNKYWIIQVYSDTDSLSLGFSKIWEEAFDKYHDYISFGRINSLTDKKLINSKVPFKVKIYPTIYILSPDGTYQIYSNIYNANIKDFQNFIANYYPSHIHNLKELNRAYDYRKNFIEIKKKGNNPAITSTYIDKNNMVILLTNKTKQSLPVKQIAFEFNNIYNTYSIKYDEIKNISNDALKQEIINSLKKLSIKKEQYIAENEKIDYFLLVSSNSKVKAIRRISSSNIKHVYADALRNSIVEINSINVDSVCSTSGARHTYCYAIVIDQINNEDNINYLKQIYKNINSSHTHYTSKLGSESSESQLFIQPVYILRKNMTGSFLKFIRDSKINMYDAFLLDYSAGSYARINEIKNLSNYSQDKKDISFLSNIYKDIEILNFEKIPIYFHPINVNWFYNTKKTFSYKLYNLFRNITKGQIILSSIIGLILYPNFKEYGKMKYLYLSSTIGATILLTSIKDVFMLLVN